MAAGEGEGAAFRAVRLDIRVETLGELLLDQQAAMFFAADLVISVHGNEITNALWMRGPGTAVVEIHSHGGFTDFFHSMVQSADVELRTVSPMGDRMWWGDGTSAIAAGQFVKTDAMVRTVHIPPSTLGAIVGSALRSIVQVPAGGEELQLYM